MGYPVYYVEENDTLPHLFDTFDGGTGASITMTGLAATDIEIYKDGGVTQRSSDNGYTLLDTDGIDFDGITGIHGFSIDLSDNSDAGFYAVGSWYHVVISSITVDGQTVSFVACAFRILSSKRGMSGTALPDVAADGAGGLPISDAGGLDLDTMNTNVSSILTDTGTTLDNHLTDIKGTGFVKDTHSLVDIEGYVDLIDDGTSGLAKIATDAAAILVDTGTTLDNHLTDIKGTGFVKDTNSLVDLPLASDYTAARAGYLDNLNTGVTLAAGAITNASLAGNMEIVFETDFASNYDSGNNRWLVDAVAISGDATVANKMEAYWDNVETGTAQAGAAGNITLAAGASATNDFYVGDLIDIISGTGAGQGRRVKSYNGTTKVATVNEAWAVQPDATSAYQIYAGGLVTARVFEIDDSVITSSVYDGSTAFANTSADGTHLTEAGGTGDHLTAVPWNASWDAEVQSEVDDALVARNLHYLVQTALPTNWTTDITANSALDYLADDGTAVFDRTTDSLQAISDSGGGGPTAAQIADAVWDEVQSGHTTAGTFGKYLDTEVSGVSGGSGAFVVTITVDDGGSTLLEGATVRMTEGVNNFIATTNSSGVATFSLDAATYTLSITKDGYSYTPSSLVISGAGNTDVSMSEIVVTPASDPDQTTAYLTAYGQDLAVAANVTFTFLLLDGPGSAGVSLSRAPVVASSDAAGLVEATLWRNSRYLVKREPSGPEVEVTTADATTYQLPEILGR